MSVTRALWKDPVNYAKSYIRSGKNCEGNFFDDLPGREHDRPNFLTKAWMLWPDLTASSTSSISATISGYKESISDLTSERGFSLPLM